MLVDKNTGFSLAWKLKLFFHANWRDKNWYCFVNQHGCLVPCLQTKNSSGAPRASVAPYLRKCVNLPIQEIWVITWPSARPPSVRTTGIPMQNNSINRYSDPNATRGYFGGKLHSHQRLVRQRQLKSQWRRKRNAEIVSVSMLSKVLSLV